MSREDRPTLLRPPEPDPNKSPIEHVLEVTELAVLGPDIFTNTRLPWQPPGARGIFGGVVISQCLASAQKTVPDDFLPHSCHCYFLLAGSRDIPILYHVERVRDGRSFATRTVQARQRGRCIFTTTISFARVPDDSESTSSRRTISHAAPLPPGVLDTVPSDDHHDPPQPGADSRRPLQSTAMTTTPLVPGEKSEPAHRRCRTWIRARGKLSPEGGRRAHLDALAYMSDSFMLGTIIRANDAWGHRLTPREVDALPEPQRSEVVRELERTGLGSTLEEWEARPRLGMMVSLDHSIYFHEPRRVRADEWMFCEYDSPWSGEERGLVIQRVFAKDGTLLASCVQEGVVRLNQDGTEQGSKL
ncbi:unnamed protein product [Clonostachys byssicola]|uniref:Acyl-coenzyme A thioesterase 8 n=1 Tax=Clonostachys byssicola TaxID=160290 RepID=A0A9N9Y774_9HYPO|nr:unnamed protein product [Clonostachys byssicola]